MVSDIWGACIEYYAAPGKSTWLMKIERRAGRHFSMSDPKVKGNQILMEEQTGNNRMWFLHKQMTTGFIQTAVC
jgi:hypothetical protein